MPFLNKKHNQLISLSLTIIFYKSGALWDPFLWIKTHNSINILHSKCEKYFIFCAIFMYRKSVSKLEIQAQKNKGPEKPALFKLFACNNCICVVYCFCRNKLQNRKQHTFPKKSTIFIIPGTLSQMPGVKQKKGITFLFLLGPGQSVQYKFVRL